MAHQAHARMDRSPKHEKQTTLQRALTTALNELGADTALVGIFEVEGGPLSLQGCRGFGCKLTERMAYGLWQIRISRSLATCVQL